MRDEVPGVIVPDSIMKRMAAAPDRDAQRAEGIAIAREALAAIRDRVAGVPVHFATFNIADSFVCVGVGLFALHIVLEEIANAKKEKEKKLLALETEASLTEQENAENVD